MCFRPIVWVRGHRSSRLGIVVSIWSLGSLQVLVPGYGRLRVHTRHIRPARAVNGTAAQALRDAWCDHQF